MTAEEVVEQLRRMSNPDRLMIIQAATRLIQDDLAAQAARAQEERRQLLRTAAFSVRDLCAAITRTLRGNFPL